MMSKKSKWIILVALVIAAMILFFNSNVIHAAINNDYPGVDSVPQEGLAQAFKDSNLIDLLARLIYAVGRFLEWLMGVIFKMLTGYSDFPWADKIVFNAVPLLDVNFINPASDSFVFNIQDVLKGLYSTMMTLAVGFFGIAVLITAIKLVLSSIASEKAKYKKAVVDWLVGFVMIFCIHYFISFTFYLNEQLVTVASEIVTERLTAADKVAAKVRHDNIAQAIINEARTSRYMYEGEYVADILDKNQPILAAWVNHVKSAEGTKGLHEALMKHMTYFISPEWAYDLAVPDEQQYKNLAMMVKWAADANISVKELRELKKDIKVYENVIGSTSGSHGGAANSSTNYQVAQAIGGPANSLWNKLFSSGSDQEYRNFLSALYNGDEAKAHVNAMETQENPMVVTTRKDGRGYRYYTSQGYRQLGVTGYHCEKNSMTVTCEDVIKTSFYWTDVIDDMIIMKSASNTSSGKEVKGSAKQIRIISDLASYFRENSYEKVRELETGMKNGKKIYIQNMIMYAVLVGQSLILFISYIKRLFYVIMLAMFAPIVVVVDFFQKFGK